MNDFHVNWLLDELKTLTEKSVITQEVSDSISNYYKSCRQEEESRKQKQQLTENAHNQKKLKRLPVILSVVSVILIFAGIVSLIAFNWQKISRGVKLTSAFTLCLIPSILYYLFYFASKKEISRKLSESLNLARILLFGAAVSFISQVLKLPSDTTAFLAVWAVYSVLIYIETRSVSSYEVSLILIFSYIISSIYLDEKTPYLFFPLCGAILITVFKNNYLKHITGIFGLVLSDIILNRIFPGLSIPLFASLFILSVLFLKKDIYLLTALPFLYRSLSFIHENAVYFLIMYFTFITCAKLIILYRQKKFGSKLNFPADLFLSLAASIFFLISYYLDNFKEMFSLIMNKSLILAYTSFGIVTAGSIYSCIKIKKSITSKEIVNTLKFPVYYIGLVILSVPQIFSENNLLYSLLLIISISVAAAMAFFKTKDINYLWPVIASIILSITAALKLDYALIIVSLLLMAVSGVYLFIKKYSNDQISSLVPEIIFSILLVLIALLDFIPYFFNESPFDTKSISTQISIFLSAAWLVFACILFPLRTLIKQKISFNPVIPAFTLITTIISFAFCIADLSPDEYYYSLFAMIVFIGTAIYEIIISFRKSIITKINFYIIELCLFIIIKFLIQTRNLVAAGVAFIVAGIFILIINNLLLNGKQKNEKK